MVSLIDGLKEIAALEADPTGLDRCKRRWEVVRHDFLAISGHKVQAQERNEMWLSMCQNKSKRRQVTTNGVWYYKTIRKPTEKNTIYLLWRGESSVIISRALAELTFMYDHLPNAKFYLLTGSLMAEHTPGYTGE